MAGRPGRTRRCSAGAVAPWLLLLLLAAPGASAAAADPPDVLRYDLEVEIRPDRLLERVTLRAAGEPPPRWVLELDPAVKVTEARCGDRPIPFEAADGGVALDLRGLPSAGGEFTVVLRAEGAPREEWKSRGFVRSQVRADVLHVRGQHPWFPRAAGDPAVHRTVVDAPAGWQVRTAGEAGPPEARGDRALWTFETAGPVDRAGIAAGPWKVVALPGEGGVAFDALVTEAHGAAAPALLAAARDAFAFFTVRFGPVPRRRFSLVEMPPEFGAGSGYGESGYVLLGPGAFEAGDGSAWLPGGIAHEVAHSWWGDAVHFRDFASETLAEYATLLFLREARGEGAALDLRRAAVERWAAEAGPGGGIALADIRGFGEGIDPGVYRVHAYEKGMMILSMIGDAAGEEALGRALARFMDGNRGRRAGWTELRAALAGLGRAPAAILERWERPGVPRLRVEGEAKRSGAGFSFSGRLLLEGGEPPLPLPVTVAPAGGGKGKEVAIRSASTPLDLKGKGEDAGVAVDPEWRVLVARDPPGGRDPQEVFAEAMKAVNDPGQADPAILARSMEALRGLLDAGAPVSRGTCRIGIGRCLFRLGQHGEAAKELEEGLAAGDAGPFHRSWALLRLGCIADLAKDRKGAEERYRAVLGLPDAGNLEFQKGKARRFLERPYRGYREDG